MKKHIKSAAILTAAVLTLTNVFYPVKGSAVTCETVTFSPIKIKTKAPEVHLKMSESSGNINLSRLSDGEYYIDGNMWHATENQPSMGNAALTKPFTLVKKGGKWTLKLEFVSLQNGIFTGYLYRLYYFPGFTGDQVPYLQKPEELVITDYYTGVYDEYNDPVLGTDPMAKGHLYPHHMEMPVEPGKSDIWVEVYVPVMEAISRGSGSQFARLCLDWSSVRKASGETTAPWPEGTGGQASEKPVIPEKTAAPESTADNAAPVPSPVSESGSGNKSGGNSGTEGSTSASQSQTENKGGEQGKSNFSVTDPEHLADGIYTVTGNMVKTDKKTASMSDDAIDHSIILKAESGKITAVMTFKGLTINKTKGYLGKLNYFKSGCTLNKYGAPEGETKAAQVISYQKDSSGNKLKDTYGTDYPAEVSFEIIPEALKDGYVPLQVFVPVMESISKGTGTQPVFLRLDWSTLKSDSSEKAAAAAASLKNQPSASSETNSGSSENSSKKKKTEKKNSGKNNSGKNKSGKGKSGKKFAESTLPGKNSASAESTANSDEAGLTNGTSGYRSSPGNDSQGVPVPAGRNSDNSRSGFNSGSGSKKLTSANDNLFNENSTSSSNSDFKSSSGNTSSDGSGISGKGTTSYNLTSNNLTSENFTSDNSSSEGSSQSSYKNSGKDSESQSGVSVAVSIIAVLAGLVYKAGTRGMFRKKSESK